MNKYGLPLKAPRKMIASERIYTLEYYQGQIYDPEQHNAATMAKAPTGNDLTAWKDYVLVMMPEIQTKQQFWKTCIPKSGVRLDDHLAGLALQTFPHTVLSENWPHDFVQSGMKRANAIPVGHPSKAYHDVGEEDMDGNKVGKDEAGFYYNRHRGIHLLCGSEGYDPETHRIIRSSDAIEKGPKGSLLWKKGDYAKVQLPVGDPRDPTPGLRTLPVRPNFLVGKWFVARGVNDFVSATEAGGNGS